jgi:aryl-alcohol dehydrogenase-like predicted oxidoreductase
MHTRKLGYTSLFLSEIGFGAWAVGGGGYAFGWGEQDDRESIAAIHHALDIGVNWIDTAPVYGLGHSEEVVGKALEGRRQSVIVATKCSLVWDGSGKVSDCLKAESILRECEASLKRLKTDVIDLYQIHWPNDQEHLEEGLKAIGLLMEQGKVRYGGVSNFHYDMNHLRRAQATLPVASLQSAYSMMRRLVEQEAFQFLTEHQIGFVAYSPMQAGLLTGTFSPERMKEGDWRRNSKEHGGTNLPINLDFIEALRILAGKYGKTVSQLAIAWVLRRPEVTSAIVGARSAAQIDETAGGAGWTLAPDDLDKIDELLEERKRRVREAGGYLHPREL